MIPDLLDVTGDLDTEVMLIVGVLVQLGAGGRLALAAPIATEVSAPGCCRKALGGELSMTFIVAEVHGVHIVGDASECLARASCSHRLVSDPTASSDIAFVFQGRLSQ